MYEWLENILKLKATVAFKTTFAALAAVLAMSESGKADISADLKFCAGLESSRERLTCYDAAARIETAKSKRATQSAPPAKQRTKAAASIQPSQAYPLSASRRAAKSSFDGSSGWNGPYVGVQIGWSSLSGSLTDSYSTLTGRTNNLSGFGGGYAGWNFNLGRYVLGAEADVSGHTGIDRTNVAGLPGYIDPNSSYRTSQNWTANLRGRAGILVSQNLLVFGAAGLAATDLSLKGPTCPSRCSSFEYQGIDVLGGTRFGWTVGAGAETAFNSDLHLKIEYLYADFGSLKSKGALNLNVATSKVRSNLGRVGISYNF